MVGGLLTKTLFRGRSRVNVTRGVSSEWRSS